MQESLPGEVTRRDQAAALAFKVVDKLFVPDLDQARPQSRAPMLHQAGVGAVIAADVGEVVGERVAHAKQGLEHRVADRHRMAPHMDDARVRQGLGDEAEIENVERRLVEQMRWTVGPAAHGARVGGAEQLGRNVARHGDALALAVCGGRELRDRERQIVEFAAALHFVAAAQNPVHKRGAAAGQAADEDRRVLGEALNRGGEVTRIESFDDLRHGARCRLRRGSPAVGAEAPRRGRAPETNSLVAAQILKLLGEGEAQGNLRVGVLRGFRAQRCAALRRDFAPASVCAAWRDCNRRPSRRHRRR